VEKYLATLTDSDIPGLWDKADRSKATIGGVIGAMNRRYTRKGEPMWYFSIEDLGGSVEAVAFPRTVAEFGQMIREDAVLLLKGRVDHRGDDIKFIVQSASEPDLKADSSVRLRVSASRMSPVVVQKLKTVLLNHPGSAPVYVHMTGETGIKVLKLGTDHSVEPRSALFAELRELFGSTAVF
jgi:DNA polymerase-3 subunit alpha